jgi:hypothetical protein
VRMGSPMRFAPDKNPQEIAQELQRAVEDV